MLKIFALEGSERYKLQKQCHQTDCYFIVHPNQTSLLKEIYQSIAYEYFHDNMQSISKKIMSLIFDFIDSKCNLTNFRQLLQSIKKNQQKIWFYQQYYYSINQQIEQNDNDLTLKTQSIIKQSDYTIVQDIRVVQCSQRPCFSQLLPYATFNCDQKEYYSQKTMEQQIIECTQSMSNAKQRLYLLLNKPKETFVAKKQKINDKQERILNQSSQQLSSFHKKGQSILLINKIDDLMHEQMSHDLIKQQIQGKASKKGDKIQQFKYNKFIKSSLINVKLQTRRNIRKTKPY